MGSRRQRVAGGGVSGFSRAAPQKKLPTLVAASQPQPTSLFRVRTFGQGQAGDILWRGREVVENFLRSRPGSRRFDAHS